MALTGEYVSNYIFNVGYMLNDDFIFKNTDEKFVIMDLNGYKYYASFKNIRNTIFMGSRLKEIHKSNPYSLDNISKSLNDLSRSVPTAAQLRTTLSIFIFLIGFSVSNC